MRLRVLLLGIVAGAALSVFSATAHADSSFDPYSYDANSDNLIQKSEVITAINDYLFEGIIEKSDVIAVINHYLFPPEPEPEPPFGATELIWPFDGPITSYFGEDRGGGIIHHGLDIDGYGRYGEAVVAAAPGQVVLVAEQTWGLGNHLIIQHADGMETVYAHLSGFDVVQGQTVAQGEIVGFIGSTGYSTGDHLHFEVRINGVPVDPLCHLPA